MAVIEPVADNNQNVASSRHQPSAPTSKSSMTIEEQLIKAEELKSSGNHAFEKGGLTEALNKWHHSLLYCAGINSFASLYGARSTDAENERAAGITSAVYNNMAACYLRQSKWEKAVYAASKTLALAPKNLKALYRRAEAYLELGRNQLAAKDIDIALDLRPEDAVIRKLGARLVQAFEVEEMERQQDRGAASST
ncbi:related to peptidyl-prolyl cis-trans isomerase [Ustilago trichophora]|uniref:Related to peptidyl-prolyl cis-trans isomerase n=1 Tax=Ustilago trichophora TaxID=86804 RepID=A0A5C3E4V9_9BASI|nr:related to peptidyl-prolyl cis-trans isomerase [Ustilago trichophora]